MKGITMKNIVENKKSVLRKGGFKSLTITTKNGTYTSRNIFIKGNEVVIFKKNIVVSNMYEKNLLTLKSEVFDYIKNKEIRLYIETQSNMLNEMSKISTYVVGNLKDMNSVKSYCGNYKRYSFLGMEVDTNNSITNLRSIRFFNNKIHFVEDKLVS